MNRPPRRWRSAGQTDSTTARFAVYDLGGGNVRRLDHRDCRRRRRKTVRKCFRPTATLSSRRRFSTSHHRLHPGRIHKINGLDLRKDAIALQRIKARRNAPRSNCRRRSRPNQRAVYCNGHGAPIHLNLKITRAKLESLVEELISRTIEPCRIAIKDAGVKVSEIDDIILVGGMTACPRCRRRSRSFFGKEPRRDVNPDEAVAVAPRSREPCCRATARICCCWT